MKHKTPLIYFFIFALVCLASIFILHHANKITNAIHQKSKISHFIIDARFTEFNKQGEVAMMLKSSKVIQYAPSNIFYFTNPYIVTYTDTTRTPWHIQAKEGMSDQTGSKIILRHHVVIHKLANAKEVDTIIKTTELTIYPKKSLAVTDQPVVLIRPGLTLHGVGLKADLKTGQYRLNSESRAVYYQTATPPNKKAKSH